MKDAIFFGLICVGCFLFGLFFGNISHQKDLHELRTEFIELTTEYDELIDLQSDQLKIKTASNKECRYTLKLILDELDYIQPRPITVTP